ncbi:MAG: MlaD family protein [Solirubrobacteraceae bacterium]
MPRVADRRRLLGALLVVVAIAGTLLAWQRPNPFSGERTVRAAFTDAGGVAPVGAEVRMAGTPVGRITGRERRGDEAIVTMKLDGDVGPIARDATAQLRPRLMFEGTAYVDLTAGTPGEPALGDAVLPATRTSTYVSLGDAFDLLGPAPAAALRTDARELRRSLSPTGSVRGTLRTAPALTRDLAAAGHAALGPHGDDLFAAVHGASRTAAAVAERRADLVPLAAAAQRTAAAADRVALPASLDRLPAVTASLDSGGHALAGTLRRTRELADAARPGAERLAPALRAVRPLLREARPVVSAARPFVDDLDGALTAAGTASRPAQEAVDAVVPTVAVLTGGLLSALERKTSLGTPAYVAFMGLFAGGGGASRPFDDGGHFMRFGFRFLTGAGSPAPPCAWLAAASEQLSSALKQVGGCQ